MYNISQKKKRIIWQYKYLRRITTNWKNGGNIKNKQIRLIIYKINTKNIEENYKSYKRHIFLNFSENKIKIIVINIIYNN